MGSVWGYFSVFVCIWEGVLTIPFKYEQRKQKKLNFVLAEQSEGEREREREGGGNGLLL